MVKNSLLALALSCWVSFQAVDGPLQDADKLFSGRDNLANLKQAITIAEKLSAAAPPSYDALWRLAKFRYYLADRTDDKDQKEKLYQAGADAAKKAIAADTNRVQGHFWLGANSGELADLKGAFESLGLVSRIRKEFEAALAIDPTYANGTTHLALGQMDLQLPRLLGGNPKRGLERLEEGLRVGANNSELKIALAEVYAKKNRQDDAKRLLESVVADPDPLRSPAELEELRTKARQMLAKIK